MHHRPAKPKERLLEQATEPNVRVLVGIGCHIRPGWERLAPLDQRVKLPLEPIDLRARLGRVGRNAPVWLRDLGEGSFGLVEPRLHAFFVCRRAAYR